MNESTSQGIDTEMLKNLCAEFPKEEVHWRAQTVTKDGSSALALAYIDARHVMDRLDDIAGVENWQDRYEMQGDKTICYISIKIDGEWTTKSDGAGDTQVEKEKGGISDAFKRAAVKWGIGRYLYSIEAPWVSCQSYKKNDKYYFKKFTQNPWDKVNGHSFQGQSSEITMAQQKQIWEGIKETVSKELLDAKSVDDKRKIYSRHWQNMQSKGLGSSDWNSVLLQLINPPELKEAAE